MAIASDFLLSNGEASCHSSLQFAVKKSPHCFIQKLIRYIVTVQGMVSLAIASQTSKLEYVHNAG